MYRLLVVLSLALAGSQLDRLFADEPAKPAAAPDRTDIDDLAGTWIVERVEFPKDSKSASLLADRFARARLTFAREFTVLGKTFPGHSFTLSRPGAEDDTSRCFLDPAKNPKEIDLLVGELVEEAGLSRTKTDALLAIYELTRNDLKICTALEHVVYGMDGPITTDANRRPDRLDAPETLRITLKRAPHAPDRGEAAGPDRKISSFTNEASILSLSTMDQTVALKTKMIRKHVTLLDAINALTTWRQVTRDQYLIYAHQIGVSGKVTLKGDKEYSFNIEPGYAATVTDSDGETVYLLHPRLKVEREPEGKPLSEPEKAAPDADPLSAYPASEAFGWNVAWHQAVRENEIRTSWFLRGDPTIAMVCTADLKAYGVTTSREVYNWAHQSTKTRELSHAQVLTLGKLAATFPKSAKSPELKDLLLVTVLREGKPKTFLYSRLDLPREIERLYDVTGAYLETEPVQ